MTIQIREPQLADSTQFLKAVAQSIKLHHPWLYPPNNEKEFRDYLFKLQQPNSRSYFLINDASAIAGVFNISEIVRGCFQSAYLGYYAFQGFNAKGLMSQGLKLVLNEVFTHLKLHRIEANIQPDNASSIHLVKANKFILEGFSKNYLQIEGVWKDHQRWALTYEEWIK